MVQEQIEFDIFDIYENELVLLVVKSGTESVGSFIQQFYKTSIKARDTEEAIELYQKMHKE